MKNSLPIHEFAKIFPDMTEPEYRSFVEDLRESRKILNPIWTYRDEIVDGRHRDSACLEVGIEPEFKEWEPEDPKNEEKELLWFVVSQNLTRRHLSVSQQQMIAAEVALKRNGKIISQEEAAEQFKVSRGGIQRATTIITDGSQRLQDAVREGNVKVGDAANVVDIPKASQDKALRKVRSGESSSVTQAAYEEALMLIAKVNSKAASDIDSGNWKLSRKRVIEIGNSPNVGKELRNERMGSSPIPVDSGKSSQKVGADTSALDREIQGLIGKLTRVFDARSKQMGGQGPYHKACIAGMKIVLDAWTEWRKSKGLK